MDNISTQDVRKGRFGEPALFLLEVQREDMNCAEKDMNCYLNIWQ